MSNRRASACLALLAVLVSGPGASAQSAQDPGHAFARLPVARQQAVLAELLARLPPSPLIAVWRQLAARADAPQHERTKARGQHRARRTIEFPQESDPLHRRLDYAFGLGIILARDGKGASGHPARTSHRPATGNGHALLDPVLLHQALQGVVPDADKALAALLQQLDTETRGDAFAAFLHSWRNGDESFYEALDRTAGTRDSVFFYDVMLDDFRGQFGSGADGKALRGGLQAMHDALHDAFLAYRQYRGFREAIAWSLLLPPDVPLPARLSRYETKVEGSYSLRQQVLMVDLALGHDLDRLLRAVAAATEPLPQPIWSAPYDPYPRWNELFTGLQPVMLEQELSTDAFLQRAERNRRELAAALQAIAAECVQRASEDGKTH